METESKTERILIDSLEMTCSDCPSQWNAKTASGRYVYIRYRHGVLKVYVANSESELFDGDLFNYDSKCILNIEPNHDSDGSMTNEELVQILKEQNLIGEN